MHDRQVLRKVVHHSNMFLQSIQAAAGGMHCVALAANHEVWTTGVNDEGALGRPTGNEPKFTMATCWQAV